MVPDPNMTIRERALEAWPTLGAASADVLAMTVDEAFEFFADDAAVRRARRATPGGRRLLASGATGHRALGRRSPAHQTCV